MAGHGDGDTERNGVNSVRRLKVGPLPPFEETVHEFVPGERILYRITKGGPLKDHVGVLEFSPTPGGGTHLEYNIRIASAIPGLAPIVANADLAAVTEAGQHQIVRVRA